MELRTSPRSTHIARSRNGHSTRTLWGNCCSIMRCFPERLYPCISLEYVPIPQTNELVLPKCLRNTECPCTSSWITMKLREFSHIRLDLFRNVSMIHSY